MKKKENKYICNSCEKEYTKWVGQCEECGNWNTLEEIKITSNKKNQSSEINFKNIYDLKIKTYERIKINMKDINSLFGNGLIEGAVYLFTVEPGVGKSTLLIEICNNIYEKIIYISGEETENQLKDRIDRLNIISKNIYIGKNQSIEAILNTVKKNKFKIVVIDSIQTMFSNEYQNSQGSIVQIRETTTKIINFAKENKVSFLITGHITKEGITAGPKILEHMVDGVFFMSIENISNFSHSVRLIQPLKNRFGATDNSVIMYMNEKGILPIDEKNIFKESIDSNLGSINYPHIIANRVVFSQIEALVTTSNFNFPRRITEGVNVNRLFRIIAVLEKFTGIYLSGHDVYLNVGGGIKNNDVAMDLSIFVSIYSSFRNIKIPGNTFFLGEIQLNGLIKKLKDIDFRINLTNSFSDFKYVVRSEIKNDYIVDIKDINTLIAYLNSF